MIRFLLAGLALFVLSVLSSGSGTASAVFTPSWIIAASDVAPDDPSIVPAGTSCPVSAPCKLYSQITVPSGQPGPVTYPGAFIGAKTSDNFVGFVEDAGVPDGAIVGSNYGSARVGPPGFCAFGPIVPFSGTMYEATTNPATTTGNSSDLSSFDHWPSQLDSVKNSYISAHPGSTLVVRTVGLGGAGGYPGNALTFLNADGTRETVNVQGDPNLPVDYVSCGPMDVNAVFLGISKDNPSTAGVNEGGVPLLTCSAPGNQVVQLTVDPDDTPPGDTSVLTNSVYCGDNTPVGSPTVNLLGGLSADGGIQLTFSNVVTPGSTSVTSSTTGPPPPYGFSLINEFGGQSIYYDIHTTADTGGAPIQICIRYPDPPGGNNPVIESAYTLLRYTGSGSWETVFTGLQNTELNFLCANTTGFSTWAIMSVNGVGGAVELVTGASDSGGSTYQTAGVAAMALAILAGAVALARKRRVLPER
jgi:hypothetical protein